MSLTSVSISAFLSYLPSARQGLGKTAHWPLTCTRPFRSSFLLFGGRYGAGWRLRHHGTQRLDPPLSFGLAHDACVEPLLRRHRLAVRQVASSDFIVSVGD